MTDTRPASSTVERSGVPTGAARSVWIELPISLARYAPRIASAFTDGQHLLKWPAVAGAAPVAAVAIGVAAEYLQASEAFTTSWAVIIAMAAVGLMSVQLGAWAFVGYVTSDLLSGRAVGAAGRSDLPEQLDWMGGLVSAAVEYLLLGLLVIGLPSLVLSGRLALRRRGLHRPWSGACYPGALQAGCQGFDSPQLHNISSGFRATRWLQNHRWEPIWEPSDPSGDRRDRT